MSRLATRLTRPPAALLVVVWGRKMSPNVSFSPVRGAVAADLPVLTQYLGRR